MLTLLKQLRGLDTDLKMINRLLKKINRIIGLKEFVITCMFLFFILSMAVPFSIHPAVYLFCFLALLVFFILIQKRFLEYLDPVKKIIVNIREKKYAESEDIKLDGNYGGLQAEIQKMFDRIKKDFDYLKKLERMRTEFLGNVSHELRTPIFAIQGYIETLLNGALNDSKVNKYFLEKANHHTENLNNLLNDLIDISMIETGELRLSFRYFRLAEFLKSVIEEFLPMAEEKGLQLILLPVNENLEVLGDKAKLKQVFTNLIQNALKYTESGKVEVIIEEEETQAKIIIKDTGLGIPEEDLERIFERFYRVDKNRSREVGGTGLGLAIVKHILEAHKSRIFVKSRLNLGSEFYFSLKK